MLPHLTLYTTTPIVSTKAFSDFTIACGGQERKVHRIILNASSGYFQAMFRVPCQETISGRLELPDDDPDLVWWMIDYIYHGHVRIHDAPPVPPEDGGGGVGGVGGVNLLETCVAMYAMGAKFQVSSLQEAAEEAIGRMLGTKTRHGPVELRELLDMVDAIDELTADRDDLRLRVWNWLGKHGSVAKRYAAEVMMHWDTGEARFSSRVHVRELYMGTVGGRTTGEMCATAGAMGPPKRLKLG
ncbi:Kelch repeat and BTB domain-containing protein 4 [Lasiodiplodia hormozganensis]|uniref:Kelch repeat and BTB domain-containing protein 4 n=1 Tax=Lasiodiplodia hormozganensis TaxID=869390 RepID=A0AA39YVK0_9PEZI|nr:Kelch repeat and BTB domain-containing protein 4 [Lasiodiplodia hormozganensis]